MIRFEEILKKLVEAKIEFVVIGGIAAVVHGSAYATNDLDIAYRRTRENIKRLSPLLKSIHAKPRNFPVAVSAVVDEKSLSFGTNFTFETDLGNLDLLAEVSGLGTYEKVSELAEPLDLYGLKIRVLSIEGLIRTKRAAGRPKDLLHLKELRALGEMKRK